MAKAPLAGTVKTRLVPPLTSQEAADLHVCFLRDMSANIDEVVARNNADGLVVYTPVGVETAFDGLFPPGFKFVAQRGESLGDRLCNATQDLLRQGYNSLCLVNSDSPTLPASLFVAARVILRAQPSGSLLLIVILFAILFRLSILFSPPYLSDDIYRYVWDGRVQAAGINPYRFIPSDESLARLRDDAIYPKINRREYAHTIYPPLSELIFFLTSRISESVTWMKATMLGIEAIAIVTCVPSVPFAATRLPFSGCASRRTVGIWRCRCGWQDWAFAFSKCLFPIDAVLAETQRFQEHCVGHLWLERVFSRH